MTGADIAQSELGYTGAGIRVAVMDTGVDYDHPDLGGDGVTRLNSSVFPTGRVVTGWDFVGDNYNADASSPAYNETVAPDPYPDDCYGHGSHVAGIIGANGAVKGVAPRVVFGSYRVFGCNGSTTSDIMVAAMERALADKMQVLNMSIGSSFQWPQYPTAQASDRLVNKGVVVVASIGNSGANGVFAAGAPGVGNKVIGVASYDNIMIRLATFTISPDAMKIGYTNAAGAPAAPFSGSLPLAKVNSVGTVPPGSLPGNDGCGALPPGSLTGKAALIRRGTCGFYDKARNAQAAGASAVVIYNNAPGRVSPTVVPTTGNPPITIPVVAVSDTEGVEMHNRLVADRSA
jgi:subtilisin family serine protease